MRGDLKLPEEMASWFAQHRHELHVVRVPHDLSISLVGMFPGAVVLPEDGVVIVHDVYPTLALVCLFGLAVRAVV